MKIACGVRLRLRVCVCVQGFITGRESQGTWLVVTYSNPLYYSLTILGCLSMLTIRNYVEELRKAENVKKDVIANLEFRNIAGRAIGATSDPTIRANLLDVKKRATQLCEGLRAKDELELAEIYPLFIGSRKRLARKLRKQLSPDWKAQHNRIQSGMFEHKRVTTDGMPLEAARANAIIWKQSVYMPTDKESQTKGYEMMLDPETKESLPTMDLIKYHERLAATYDMRVDQVGGQKFLFSNRMLPIIWPSACKFPFQRDPENEIDPNDKYMLGQKGHKWCPPVRVFIGGPVIKNVLLLSRVGKWIMAPMNALNIWVLTMQYSTRSVHQIMGDMIARSKTLSKFRKTGHKVMAAQEVIGELAKTAAFVAAVDAQSGGGVLGDLAEATTSAAVSQAQDAGEKITGVEQMPDSEVTEVKEMAEGVAGSRTRVDASAKYEMGGTEATAPAEALPALGETKVEV